MAQDAVIGAIHPHHSRKYFPDVDEGVLSRESLSRAPFTADRTLCAGSRHSTMTTARCMSSTSMTTLGFGGGIDTAFPNLMSALHGGEAFPPLTDNDCVTLDPVTLSSVRQGDIGNIDEHNVSWRRGVDL